MMVPPTYRDYEIAVDLYTGMVTGSRQGVTIGSVIDSGGILSATLQLMNWIDRAEDADG